MMEFQSLLAASESTAIALLLIGAYFCGSIPFGLLAGKARGIDVRDYGSGNIGATNVYRICGPAYGIVVFLLDFTKGLAPTALALELERRGVITGAVIPIITALMAIVGHNYTCWLGFRGGKGIAASAGALTMLLPWPLLLAAVIWAALLISTRYMAIASMGAALSLPIVVAVQRWLTHEPPMVYLIFTIVLAALAVWRHRSNIQRLLAGTEHRFGKRRDEPAPN